MKSTRYTVAAALVFACSIGITRAAEPDSLDDAWGSFSNAWHEDDWVPKTGLRTRFMRPLDDPGWKARMLALQTIVREGPRAVEPMRRMLREGDGPRRALAAQALGFLPAQAAREDLLHAAANDALDVVRLYAIDSLGMLGGDGTTVDWESLGKNQKNRDVKRHLAYAAERAGKPLNKMVIDALKSWDASRMDSARVGQMAPNFELASVDGETIRLSDYRGKKAVVLVFIYGDT